MAKKTKPKTPDMKTCRLVVEVTYDANITDDESLAIALDRLTETAMSTPGILDEYGDPIIGEFLFAEEPSLRYSSANPPTSPTKKDRETKLLASGHMTDDANPSVPSIPFRVTQETYGISVAALDDTGHQLGEVLLDYHDNRLACQCYHPDIDDVVSTYVFSENVKKARKGKKTKKE